MASRRKRGRPPHDDILTKTEWSIVHAVQHGMTTREIATRRGVSFDAVKLHIDNAMERWNRAGDRTSDGPRGRAIPFPGLRALPLRSGWRAPQPTITRDGGSQIWCRFLTDTCARQHKRLDRSTRCGMPIHVTLQRL